MPVDSEEELFSDEFSGTFEDLARRGGILAVQLQLQTNQTPFSDELRKPSRTEETRVNAKECRLSDHKKRNSEQQSSA